MQKSNGLANTLLKLLPLISFAIALAILYLLDPASFELTWKGRTYQLFFAWLILLETILNWDALQPKLRLKSMRFAALAMVLTLPTIYVILTNYYGFNGTITNLFAGYNREERPVLFNLMFLSFEYLAFAVIFASIVTLEYGIQNLGKYAISAFFSGLIGAIYVIDNLYPNGYFTPFQIIVPTTTMLAASVLGAMGYTTTMGYMATPKYGAMTYLSVRSPTGGSAGYGVAWPCSGVESLLIYTVTILLFLKNSSFPWLTRTVLFTVGAIVTYFINILRIVTIFVIAVQGGDILPFHNYYGQLYSIVWIISYPLMILGLQSLWNRREASKELRTTNRSAPT
jgi:exosortase/archaeosortase family protein